jgi:cysteine protease ATG4
MLPAGVSLTFLVQLLHRYVDDAVHVFTEYKIQVDTPVYSLGTLYQPTAETVDEVTSAFISDINSRMFFSYRRGMDGLAGGLHSDAGWGCSIRSVQMLIAQSMLNLQLGPDWRLSPESDRSVYDEIASRFLDTNESVLSVQRVVESYQLLDMDYAAGEYTSPGKCAYYMADLWKSAASSDDIGMVSFNDGVMYTPEIREALHTYRNGVIVTLSVMLSANTLDPSFHASLIELFKSTKFFQGLVAADFSRAYYVPAINKDYLLCMDPHVVHDALKSKDDIPQLLMAHGKPYAMRWSRVNGQVAFGFTIRSIEEFDEFIDFVKQEQFAMLLPILETRPRYEDIADLVIDEDLFESDDGNDETVDADAEDSTPFTNSDDDSDNK